MREGRLKVQELITHRLTLEEAAEQYGAVLHDPTALGILVDYPSHAKIGTDTYFSPRISSSPEKSGTATHFSDEKKVAVPIFPPTPGPLSPSAVDTGTPYLIPRGSAVPPGQKVAVGVIGAGNYARSILLPELARTEARLAAVADLNGAAAAHAARKFGAGKALTDYREILADPAIQAVFVLVGHHLHARFVGEVVAAGKHVFVEKPLAITEEQLDGVRSLKLAFPDAANEPAPPGNQDANFKDLTPQGPMVMAGFNQRFSAHTVKMRELLAGRTEPLTMTMTVNAGFIPPEHWTQDPERGGGRIIGEGCHFIDLLACLARAPVTSVAAAMVGGTAPAGSSGWRTSGSRRASASRGSAPSGPGGRTRATGPRLPPSWPPWRRAGRRRSPSNRSSTPPAPPSPRSRRQRQVPSSSSTNPYNRPKVQSCY